VASLRGFGGEDLASAGEAIRGFARTSSSMEESASSVADFLWDDLRDDDGEPACALVRVYKTHRFGALPPELATFAAGLLDGEVDAETRCLTLLATRGVEPEWNDRRLSVGHQAIPLPSPEFVERLPMVAGLIEQLGLDLRDVVRPQPARVVELAQRTYSVFHVEHARGSELLPAQEFVERYGVASALGFGGVLFTGDFFAVVLFARVPVVPRVAETIRVLSLATRVALMRFGTRVFA
jgi:hypothetical protein